MTRSEIERRQMRRRIREILVLRRVIARPPQPEPAPSGGAPDDELPAATRAQRTADR